MQDLSRTIARTLDSAGLELLSTLLLSANASIGTDIAAARQCIERARALVGQSVARQRALGDEIRAQRGGLAPWQARRVTSYIEDHLGGRIRVEDLARHVGLSASHLFRAFKEAFGHAPMVHVARRRIDRAKELMISSPLPLAQIALECGLCDQPHFTRLFKRVAGESPSAWRRAHAAPPLDGRAPGAAARSDTPLRSPTPVARPSI